MHYNYHEINHELFPNYPKNDKNTFCVTKGGHEEQPYAQMFTNNGYSA